MTDDEVFEALAAPFHPTEIRQRQGGGGQIFDYVTPRTVRRRLNEVLGPQGWEKELSVHDNCVRCVLTIKLPSGTVLSRAALGGYPPKLDAENTPKAGDSDAFKRAAAEFGVAEYLYKEDTHYVEAATGAPRRAQRTTPGGAKRPTGKRDDRPLSEVIAAGVDQHEAEFRAEHPDSAVIVTEPYIVVQHLYKFARAKGWAQDSHRPLKGGEKAAIVEVVYGQHYAEIRQELRRYLEEQHRIARERARQERDEYEQALRN